MDAEKLRQVKALIKALFEAYPTGPGEDGNRSWSVTVGPPNYDPSDSRVYRMVNVVVDGRIHPTRMEWSPTAYVPG
jgi:hypothetical protein